MSRRSRINTILDSNMYSLPLKREVRTVLHFIHTQTGIIKTGLDVGFTNAGVSRLLRLVGGYWMTAEPTPQRRALVAGALGEETALSIGANGELPFEDKQFDVVVLAHGSLSGHADANMIVRECHRVLRADGLLLFTVEYRKRLGMPGSSSGRGVVSGAGGCYTESEAFYLLKDGFDVLGTRFSCRFWVQLVRQWVDKRKVSGIRGANNGWLRMLYGMAWMLDLPLFWTRGHQMTVCARRKGWRGGKPLHVVTSHTPVSDAILFDPRSHNKRFDMQKFK